MKREIAEQIPKRKVEQWLLIMHRKGISKTQLHDHCFLPSKAVVNNALNHCIGTATTVSKIDNYLNSL